MAVGYVAGMAADAALSTMAAAIKALYGIGVGINEYFDEHIEKLKASENTTVSRTGSVLEAAKLGFGMGYISSVVIVATGQVLLGNTLSAVVTLATAATLTNPIAMTCAAVGAIYYGWGALSTQEQSEILDKLTKGLEIGAELIKSVVQFLIAKTKELFSAKNFAEFKTFIKDYSSKFGKSLYEVTGTVTDFVTGTAERAGELTVIAAEKVGETAADVAGASARTLKVAYERTGEAASEAAGATAGAFKEAYRKVGDVAGNVKASTKRALTKRSDSNGSISNDEDGRT